MLGRWFRRKHRRWFGRYEVEDPRPIAEAAPYTYFLPSENELLALGPGDLAKLNFESIPPSSEWDGERMWVCITSTDADRLTGTLANDPLDMPQLRAGSPIAFRRSDVIDLIWNEDRSAPPPPAPKRREYWQRCVVDDCVLNCGKRVHYLYRETPEPLAADEKYLDSGWRIRGDYRGLSHEEVDARETQYVALGAVLNDDDSWLHLIDAAVGSAFLRNWETDAFEAAD